MVEKIRQRLQQAFAPMELEVRDDGHKHAGHTGDGKGHFHVRIVSEAFAGQTPLKCHRMIYEVVDDLMNHGIHALSIDASPNE